MSKDKKAEKPAAVVGKSKGKVEKKIPLPEMDPDHGDDDQDDKDEEEEEEMWVWTVKLYQIHSSKGHKQLNQSS